MPAVPVSPVLDTPAVPTSTTSSYSTPSGQGKEAATSLGFFPVTALPVTSNPRQDRAQTLTQFSEIQGSSAPGT